MKKFVLVLVLVLAMAVPVFAAGEFEQTNTLSPGAINISNGGNGSVQVGGTSVSGGVIGGAGGNATNITTIGGGLLSSTLSPSAEASARIGDIDNSTRNTNTNLNTNIQGQDQKQKQQQQQSSVNVNDNTAVSTSKSKSSSEAVNLNQQIVESTQQLIPNASLFPMPVPMIQGGRVGDVTAQMPKFAGPKPLGKDDLVVDVKVKSGNIFDRVRLEDIEIDLMAFYSKTVNNGDGSWNPAKTRYLIQYKDSTFGAGISGGGQAGGSGLTNQGVGVQGSGGLIPSVGRSTTDPMYIIKLYLIQ